MEHTVDVLHGFGGQARFSILPSPQAIIKALDCVGAQRFQLYRPHSGSDVVFDMLGVVQHCHRLYAAQIVPLPDVQPLAHGHFAGGGIGAAAVTGFCCLGGCEMDVYPFQSERDALLFSVLLKEIGYQPPHNIACEKCYQEYMSEQIGGIDLYAK